MELNLTTHEIEGADEPLLRDVDIFKDLLSKESSLEEAAILISEYGVTGVYFDVPPDYAVILREHLPELDVYNTHD